MTVISRYSAETLKNITFFEKFGKKNAKFFSLFFPFFRGFSGKFFTRFLVVYTSLQSGFPKSTPKFPEIPGGKFREIFGHFFVDFSEKKSGNLEGLPCVTKRKLKKTRFFSKNRRNKKKTDTFFSGTFFFSPRFFGGSISGNQYPTQLKTPKNGHFSGKFPEIFVIFGNFRGTQFPEKWSFLTKFRPNFARKILDSSLKRPTDPRGDPPGKFGGKFRGISGNFRNFPGDNFPENSGNFFRRTPFSGKKSPNFRGVIRVSSRETRKNPRNFPGFSGNFRGFRKFSRGSPENPRGKFFQKCPPGEKIFRKIRGIFFFWGETFLKNVGHNF